jgi:hypothetical protein|tara:strand:- start:868 stop:1200 length:333 start_codon:yes stop_codon:yes gene_type:complete
MANAYINTITSLTSTSSTSVYTVPTATTAIVKMMSVYNSDGSNAATITIQVTDTSASATKTFDKESIAAETKKAFLQNGEVLILDESDILKMTAGTANYFDVFMSTLEIS